MLVDGSTIRFFSLSFFSLLSFFLSFFFLLFPFFFPSHFFCEKKKINSNFSDSLMEVVPSTIHQMGVLMWENLTKDPKKEKEQFCIETEVIILVNSRMIDDTEKGLTQSLTLCLILAVGERIRLFLLLLFFFFFLHSFYILFTFFCSFFFSYYYF